MAPVEKLSANPTGAAEYVPPVYAPVPVSVTDCGVGLLLQNGAPA